MAKWFEDHIPNFNMDHAVWHPKDSGPIYDWNTDWRDPPLEQHLKALECNKDLPIGTIKGKKRYFTWFTDDADIFVSSVGNDDHTWFTESDEYKKETFSSMFRNYNKAIKLYYPDKNGKLPVPTHPTPAQAAEGIQVRQKTVPFGPWLFWSKSDWDVIDRQWSLHCRQRLRAQTASTTTTDQDKSHTHAQSHPEQKQATDHQHTKDKPTKSKSDKSKSKRDKHHHRNRSKRHHHHRNRSKSHSRSRSRSRSRDRHKPSHAHKSKSPNQSPKSPIHSDNSQVSSSFRVSIMGPI